MRELPLQSVFVWHSYLLIAICGLFAAVWPCEALICGLLVFALDQRLWQFQRFFMCVILSCACFCAALWHFNQAEETASQPPQWLARKNQRVCGQITRTQSLPDKRLRMVLQKVKTLNEPPLPGYCLWTWDEPTSNPLPGQTVCLTRSIKPASGFANERGNSWSASQFAQNYYWRIWSKGDSGNPVFSGKANFWAAIRARLLQDFTHALAPDSPEQISQAKAILLALLFGDRFHLKQATINQFSIAAIAHSLALSGQHLGIVGLIAWLAVSIASLCQPGIYLSISRVPLVLITSLPFAAIYLWLGNAPSSLQRAAAMLLMAAIFITAKIPFSGLDLLCAALLLLLMLNPLAVFDIGLQLSVLCVLVIIITWPALNRLLQKFRKKPMPLSQKITYSLITILFISLLIQISLLPLTLIRFQQIGLLFPINLVWLPTLGMLVLPLGVIGLIFSAIPLALAQNAATTVLAWAALPCQALLNFLAWLEQHHLLGEPAFLIPHWSALPGFALLIACLAWNFGGGQPQKRRIAAILTACALITLAVGPAERLVKAMSGKIRITAFDVGQGEALLVEAPDSVRMLIDGGGSYSQRFDIGKAIVGPLAAANVPPRLEAVINSHPDLDHLGGLIHILNSFTTAFIAHNGRPAQKSTEAVWHAIQARPNAHALCSGDSLIIGKPEADLRLEVLHPPRNDPKWQGNSASLTLRLVWHGRGIALFPGDADKTAQKHMLENKANLQADIVIAPHHGSDLDTMAEFYKAANPRIVIACCGFLNFRRYPGNKLRKLCAAMGIPLLDTGAHGKIAVEIDPNGQLKTGTTARRGRPRP